MVAQRNIDVIQQYISQLILDHAYAKIVNQGVSASGIDRDVVDVLNDTDK